MKYPATQRFDFSRNGRANRRDDDALPRVLLTAIHFTDQSIDVHVAGDEYVRVVTILEAVHDDDLIGGMEPIEAMRVGIEYQRIRDKYLHDQIAWFWGEGGAA